MTIGCHYSINNTYPASNPHFRAGNSTTPKAILNKPIETVSKTIESTVDPFIPEQEKKKKSNKKAIVAGSAALVATGAVALLNPKFSSKFLTKMKKWAQDAGIKGEKNADNEFKNKFYRMCHNGANKTMKIFEFVNTGNATKDIMFKQLCTENKTFSKVKNESFRKFLQKIDNGFVKVMTKINNTITTWFDKISKKTVLGTYKKTNKKLDNLDLILKQYKEKLSPEKQLELEKKLQEITELRKHFSESNVESRLLEQENLMSNLEEDFKAKLKNYVNTLKDKNLNKEDKKKYFKENMDYWAETILKDKKLAVQKDGDKAVKDIMKKYDEIFYIFDDLSLTEQQSLRNRINKIGKKLSKANDTECNKYFDKKRDLVLGGGPTDIVSSLGSLGLCGLAIASADTKEDQVSKALTTGFPLVGGVLASLGFTAMLFSGAQGLLFGGLTSVILSKTGSIINKVVRGKDIDKENNINVDLNNPSANNPFKPQEITYA